MPWLSLRRWRKRALLVGAAMLSGLLAILFAIGAEFAIEGHDRLMKISPLLALIIAPAGFAAMAYLCRKYFPGTQGSGIPQTIAASITNDDKLRRALLSWRIIFGKMLLTLGGLLSGATIGREGPSVQVGASVLNMLSGKKRGRIAPTRDLIIAGGAAGVAAAFNTPLGGIMFAIEELSRNRPFMANSMTLIAVIFAGLMSLATLGSYTYFGVTQATLSWPAAIWPIIACGASGGLLGGLFTRLLIGTTRNLPGRLGAFARLRPVRFAALCGLGTALIGLLSGGLSYGTGYAEIKHALEGTTALPAYYGLAKAAAIVLAFVSGIPGGLFAPALAVGAGVGTNVAAFFPEAQSQALLALCMVAFLGGVTQSPITAFVIVMEMTANHSLLLPLMCASVISHAFSRTVAPTPLYDAMAYAILRRNTFSRRTHQTAAAARRQQEERAAAEAATAELVATAVPAQPAEQPAILRSAGANGDAAPRPAVVRSAARHGLPPIAAIFKRRTQEVPALQRPPLAGEDTTAVPETVGGPAESTDAEAPPPQAEAPHGEVGAAASPDATGEASAPQHADESAPTPDAEDGEQESREPAGGERDVEADRPAEKSAAGHARRWLGWLSRRRTG